MGPGAEHWAGLARLWSLLGPPLRPSPQDIAFASSVVGKWRAAHPAGRMQVLVLGVTPELVTLPWPGDAQVVAVDRSAAMIDAVWPKAGAPPNSSARLGDWRNLDMPDGSIDLVVADGAYTVLSTEADQRRATRELGRVLRGDGRMTVRLFASPEVGEHVSDVATALWSGAIGSIHVLKWRLAMALQADGWRAVPVAAIWRAFCDVCPDPSRLVDELGWASDLLDTIATYRESPTVYAFPTLAQTRAILGAHFEEQALLVPSYELGDRCPTLVASPRRSG